MMIVPEVANMPPTPWQIDLDARDLGPGEIPRIWRALLDKPECIVAGRARSFCREFTAGGHDADAAGSPRHCREFN
jgi:hypothetical protein